MNQARHGFSMPGTMPLFGPPPYEYEGNRMLSIPFRTKKDVVRKLVPEPLVPNDQGRLVYYVGEFKPAVPYLEAGIYIPCLHGDRPGAYFVLLYLDKTNPIVVGREIYGFPKKEARISFEVEKTRVWSTVERNGVILVEAALQLGDPLPIPADRPSSVYYNLKLIPSIRQGAPPDVMQITACPTDGRTRELRGGEPILRFGTSHTDPLEEIPILEILGGTLAVSDMTLGWGEVAHDYLAES